MRSYLFIFAILLIPSLQAASFDCNKASTKVEKMICANKELSALDDALSQAYKSALNEGDDAPLILDQKKWLKKERNLCTNTNCLIEAYNQRISILQSWNTYVTPYEDLDGNYVLGRGNSIFDGSEWKSATTTDCLTLQKISPTEVKFSFNLVQTNAHLCSMEGIAILEKNKLIHKIEMEGEEDDCELLIKFKARTIELVDTDGKCRHFHCGARAGINGIEFLRRSKSRNNCSTN